MTDKLNETLIEPISGLTYRVRPGESGEGKAPCLILLHGVGANELGFIEMAKHLDPRLTVVLARGPLEFGVMQFGWFQVHFTNSGPSINPMQANQARQKLLSFIGQLPQQHEIDPARIWIAGFSQGGIMSASVGLTAPEKIVGFGLFSGRIMPEVLPLVQPGPALQKVRAFVSHGVQDDKLGIHFARNAKQVLDGYKVPLQYHEYQASHTLNVAMVDDFKLWLAPQI
ncbi:alpha/beta hydrolase [Janthinobacterium sp. HLX7-2]|uniref:alpha/beta hydrolase n=1 Tax=Janthinobacterium sp. HLX7-2 TaxID=1259331 RepID=UPI003F1F7625